MTWRVPPSAGACPKPMIINAFLGTRSPANVPRDRRRRRAPTCRVAGRLPTPGGDRRERSPRPVPSSPHGQPGTVVDPGVAIDNDAPVPHRDGPVCPWRWRGNGVVWITRPGSDHGRTRRPAPGRSHAHRPDPAVAPEPPGRCNAAPHVLPHRCAPRLSSTVGPARQRLTCAVAAIPRSDAVVSSVRRAEGRWPS